MKRSKAITLIDIFAYLMNDLLDVPPEIIPIPQQAEEKEETPATIAAEHWETQPVT